MKHEIVEKNLWPDDWFLILLTIKWWLSSRSGSVVFLKSVNEPIDGWNLWQRCELEVVTSTFAKAVMYATPKQIGPSVRKQSAMATTPLRRSSLRTVRSCGLQRTARTGPRLRSLSDAWQRQLLFITRAVWFLNRNHPAFPWLFEDSCQSQRYCCQADGAANFGVFRYTTNK